VEAADGYSAVIALPEIDPDFTDKQIVLAFLQDGKPLRFESCEVSRFCRRNREEV